jgi:hypothetical protein
MTNTFGAEGQGTWLPGSLAATVLMLLIAL